MLDANAQLRRAEPDAPYRRTDVYPIEIFRRNLRCSLKTAKYPFYLRHSRQGNISPGLVFWASDDFSQRKSQGNKYHGSLSP